MDVFNIAKSIEKLIFELLMMLIFYPYTLFRVIFQPSTMMDYAKRESLESEDVSFDSGMKPAIFLFLSIVIAAYIAPVQAKDFAEVATSAGGQYITASSLNLLIFRMVIYSIFPITFALVYDLITPGQVTRHTLVVPFNQQCYICAPFTLVTSFSMVLFPKTENVAYFLALVAAQIWLIGSNYIFFRGQAQKSRPVCAAISISTFLLAWVVFLGVTNIVLRTKGLS